MKSLYWNVLGIVCLTSSILHGLRDPFMPVIKDNRYACCAVGCIENTNRYVALLCIDGITYRVRPHDVLVGHTIVSVSADGIVLTDEQGVERRVVLKKV